MAGGITINQARDLGIATLKSFEQDMFQITLKHQTYEMLNQFFKPGKKKTDSGKYITRDIVLRDSNQAQHVNMYETTTPGVANTAEEIVVNWTHARVDYSYSRKEINMNKNNPVRIYNLLEQRRKNAFIDLANLLEEDAWKTPTSSSDTKSPHGVPGWIGQMDNGTTAGSSGFIGYTPNYWTTSNSRYNAGSVACSATENPRWANYYADHQGTINETTLDILDTAFRKTHFKSPMFAKQAIDPKSDFSNFRMFTTNDVLKELNKMARKSDDALGPDLGKYAGSVIFKGVPFVYADFLDTAKQYVYGSDPIFGVNFNHFYPVILDGEEFLESEPMTEVGQPDTLTIYVDVSYGFICDNRRAGGFLVSSFQGT